MHLQTYTHNIHIQTLTHIHMLTHRHKHTHTDMIMPHYSLPLVCYSFATPTCTSAWHVSFLISACSQLFSLDLVFCLFYFFSFSFPGSLPFTFLPGCYGCRDLVVLVQLIGYGCFAACELVVLTRVAFLPLWCLDTYSPVVSLLYTLVVKWLWSQQSLNMGL